MNLIKEVLLWIEYFEEKFQVTSQKGNRYYSAVKNIQKYAQENAIALSEEDRQGIENFLLSLEIPLMKENIYKICFPNTELPDTNALNGCTLSQLTDAQLVEYMMFVFSTVSMNENGNLLLLKYNIIIWNTGFHKFAQLSRGKILEIETKEIVSYPFDKFFNVNEVADTKEELVKKRMENNRYLYVTDKKDGSTIIVSKYQGKSLITTNGSFDNEQIAWAKQIFAEKYPAFLEQLEERTTYIFELIHPQNRIVIDYGEEKDLYLLAVRNVESGEMLPLFEIHGIAKKFGFPCPEAFSFNSLDDIIRLAHNLTDVNKEGWVLRIGAEDGHEYMLKIKLDQYFQLHSAIDKVKLLFVYRHLLENNLDDFLAIATDAQKETVNKKLEEVQTIQNAIKEQTIILANQMLSEQGLTLENCCDNREAMIALIQKVLATKNPFKNFTVQYIKKPESIDSWIANINLHNFKIYAKLFGFDYNA